MKKERATTSDEQRERTLIAEQIERAAAEAQQAGTSRIETPPEEQGLKRDEGAEKVVLSLSAKPVETVQTAALPLKLNAFKSNPLKPAANPLKRPNILKTAAASEDNESKKRALPMSAAERLIVEEQERKRRRMHREAMN
jgi:DNA/RNA-binding protein KIN17